MNGSIAGSYDLSTLSNGYIEIWLHIVVTRTDSDLIVWAGYSDNTYTKIIGSIVYANAIPTNGLDFYICSENAANTYYNGLISNFRWVTGMSIYGSNPPTYPTSPLVGYNGIKLLIGQGTSLSSQLTDQTGYSTITNTNCTYNAYSGISGYDGSIQFGTI